MAAPGWRPWAAAASLAVLAWGPGAAAAEDLADAIYQPEDVVDFLAQPWKLNLQPTWERQKNGSSSGYVLLQPYLRFDLGLLLWTRFEWPVPQVDTDAGGSVTAGVGDLQWLNLIGLGGSERWGKFGFGPVFVFPTASSAELGQGKFQIGPALGYVNRGVKGWQFALLLQQFFSFAGDPGRAPVNTLKLQPFVTRFLPGAWYVQTKPIIELNFAGGTSRVPLSVAIGKVVGGRFDVYVEGTAYPDWTSTPTTDYKITVNLGYLFPSPLARP